MHLLVLLLPIAVLVATAQAQNTTYGNGSALFTYSNPHKEEGVQVVYRPDEIMDLIVGNEDKFQACIVFEIGLCTRSHNSHECIRTSSKSSNYMRWSKEGEYFYATNPSAVLVKDKWVIFNVKVYNKTYPGNSKRTCIKLANAKAFYAHLHGVYLIPENITYCGLEKDDISYTLNYIRCSLIMNGTSPGDFRDQTHFPPPPNDYLGLWIGVAVWIVLMAGIVGLTWMMTQRVKVKVTMMFAEIAVLITVLILTLTVVPSKRIESLIGIDTCMLIIVIFQLVVVRHGLRRQAATNLQRLAIQFVNSDGGSATAVTQIVENLTWTHPKKAVELFQSHGCADMTPLQLAAHHGHCDLIKKFVAHTKNEPDLVELFRQQDLFGRTVGSLLSKRGDDVLSMVKTLSPEKKEQIQMIENHKEITSQTNVDIPKRKNVIMRVLKQARRVKNQPVLKEANKTYKRLEKLEEHNKELTNDHKQINEQHEKILEAKERLEQRLQEEREELKYCRQERDEWKKKYEEKQQEKENIQQQLEKVEQQISERPRQPHSQTDNPKSDLSELWKKREELEKYKRALSRLMAEQGKKLDDIQRKIREIKDNEEADSQELEECEKQEAKYRVKKMDLEEKQEKNNEKIKKCDEKIQELQLKLVPDIQTTFVAEQAQGSDDEIEDTMIDISDAEDDSFSDEEEEVPASEESPLLKRQTPITTNVTHDIPSEPMSIDNEMKPEQATVNIEKPIDIAQLLENFEREIRWSESEIEDHQSQIQKLESELRDHRSRVQKLEERIEECKQETEEISAQRGIQPVSALHGDPPATTGSVEASVHQQIHHSIDDKKTQQPMRNLQKSANSPEAYQRQHGGKNPPAQSYVPSQHLPYQAGGSTSSTPAGQGDDYEFSQPLLATRLAQPSSASPGSSPAVKGGESEGPSVNVQQIHRSLDEKKTEGEMRNIKK